MKAIVCHQYGSPDVLRLEDVEKPVPEDDEVLVKIHAASVNAADWRMVRADPWLVRLYNGLLRPKHKILGADVAGRIEAVGSSAKQFRPGDDVFGDLFECGWGGFAEYACAREKALAFKPANLSYEEAAAVPLAGLTALHGLRDKGKIQAGQKVLIVGASGGVGTFAVQIAKAFGAEVTAVCSTRNVEQARSLGAAHVIDYTRDDFTKSGQRYDLILAIAGDRSIFEFRQALTPAGTYVAAGGGMAQIFQAMLLGPWISMAGKNKMGNVSSLPNQADLNFLKGLLEARKVVPVIDRRYPLRETADAIRYVEAGHARGKVVITM